MKTCTTVITVIALLIALAGTTFGDTVELRDGKLLKGRYVGGTAGTIRLEVGKETKVISVSDIVAITFDAREKKQEPAAKEPTADAGKKPASQDGEKPTGQDGKPAAPVTGTIRIPAGSAVLMSMDQTLDSKKHKPGTVFTGKLAAPLQIGQSVVLPIGTPVYGKLTEAKKGGRLARRAELKLELTHIMIGEARVALATSDVQAKGDSQGTVGKVGAGAAIGGIAKGSKGARRGAAVGATAAAITSSQINVPKGTLLEFKLKTDLVFEKK